MQAILKIMRQKPKTQDEVKETSRKEIFTCCWQHWCLQQLAKLFYLLLGTENREFKSVTDIGFQFLAQQGERVQQCSVFS